jgi:hypothetical protein
MKKALRILLLTAAFTGLLLPSFADRGLGKKKNKVVYWFYSVKTIG